MTKKATDHRKDVLLYFCKEVIETIDKLGYSSEATELRNELEDLRLDFRLGKKPTYHIVSNVIRNVLGKKFNDDKAKIARLAVFEYFVGCVYNVLSTVDESMVTELDGLLAELIEDFHDTEDDDSQAVLKQHQYEAIRAGVKNAIGKYAIAVANSAPAELALRSKNRVDIMPTYVEEDV